MPILTKCHRHHLFVEGEIGTGNRIPEECTIHDNHSCPPAGRALTYFSPARKVSKSACAVARFPGGTARPSSAAKG
ncbi:MAG: hypothetical protein WCQ55_07445 [Paludibacteraceae bacterium]